MHPAGIAMLTGPAGRTLTPGQNRAVRRPGRGTVAGALAAAVSLGMLGGGSAGTAAALSQAEQIRQESLGQLQAIDVPTAWHVSTGRGVTVGVLDTGADPGTPDLAGSVITGPDFTAGADPPGYRPPHLHGTYISSIIAAHGSGPGRSGGMIGVAPAAKILSVRVILDRTEPGFSAYSTQASYYDAVAKGIRYAVRHGAGVINMSLGSTGAVGEVQQAVGYAIAHGVVVVAAAGNNGTAAGSLTPFSYPASFAGVISVGAVLPDGRRAPFSDRNSAVVLSAPGENITGDGPGGSYLGGSGTSPATAFVSGVAALIRSRYPHLRPALVTQALISSTQHRPPGGYSPGVGFGEVDAAAALAAAGRLARDPAPAGMPPAARFGTAPRPAAAAPGRRPSLAGPAAVTAIAAFGFLAACAELIVLRRRRARAGPLAAAEPSALPGRRAPAEGPAPAGPRGPAE